MWLCRTDNIAENRSSKQQMRVFEINFPPSYKNNINVMSTYMLGPNNKTTYVRQKGKLINIDLGLQLIYQQSILNGSI